MKRLFHNCNYAFLVLLLLFVPFWNLIFELLSAETTLSQGVVFWLIHWYEPVAVILLGLLLIVQFKNWGGTQNRLLLTILILTVYGVISILLFAPSISRGIEGFRFSLFMLVPMSMALLENWNNVERRWLLTVYKTVALTAAVLAVAEQFLPLGYWANIGIVSANSVFGFGHYRIVSVYQSASFIGAPNQLATFLLPAFFLKLKDVFSRQDLRWRLSQAVQLVVFLLAISLTFSRSGIVGFVVGYLLYAALSSNRKVVMTSGFSAVIIMVVLSTGAFLGRGQYLPDLWTHGASQVEHTAALNTSLNEVKDRMATTVELIFGSGLGTAGPSVLKYGDGIISESWFMQILLELGVVGLALWLLLSGLIAGQLYKYRDNEEFAIVIGFISVSVAAIFLHSFADNPAMSLTLFTLLGVFLSRSKLVVND